MERNIGQALGLGVLAVPDTGQSTVLPRNLHRLELLAKKIDPPAWPMAWFKLPPIDKARASEARSCTPRTALRATTNRQARSCPWRRWAPTRNGRRTSPAG